MESRSDLVVARVFGSNIKTCSSAKSHKYYIMRDLINIIEGNSILTEKSRGLLFRAKGDRFFKGNRNNPESVLLFDKAELYPNNSLSYPSHEDMMSAYQQLEKKYIGIQAVNKPTSASKAFAVIKLMDEKTKKPVYFSRFFNSLKPDMAGTWSNGDMKDFGYQLEKETSLKASYGLKPSDLFDTPITFKSPSDLLNTVKQTEAAQPFIPGLEMLFLNPPQFPIFEGLNEFYTAIRDDLGELIGPMALIQGLDCGTGAKAASKDLLANKGYGNSGIRFPGGKTNGLVDSYILTPMGVEIGISSKGEKGATASIKNVADGITAIKKLDASKDENQEKVKLLTTYAKEVKLIERIGRESTIDFPLNYAIENQLLSQDAADVIRELIKTGAKTLDQVQMSEDVAVELTNLTGYKGAKTSLPNYNIGYHALSGIAELIANQVNSDPKFGEACLKFLNSSPVVQLHMKVSKQKDSDVKVIGFESKYPPNFKGTVALDPSKNYTATMAGGRMNFAYDGVDAGVPGDERATSDTPAAELSTVAKQITRESYVGRKKRK